MFKTWFYLLAILGLCSSCVSRTTYKEPGLKGDTASGKGGGETRIIWVWDKEFNPR